jgi:hypothetical protein
MMARQAKSNYIEAAIQVLTELGGGPLSSKDLVKAAQERGLIGTTQYVYHNFLRKVRESNLFDTSIRGQIVLNPGTESLSEDEGRPGSKTPDATLIENAPATVISEILTGEQPETNALDDVEDEEIDPDGVQADKGF